MTEQTKWDIKVTVTLIVIAAVFGFLSFGCEKKCSKGEVKLNGKCYVPGTTYLKANGSERMV